MNGFLAALLAFVLCAADATGANQRPPRPVGALRATGEVRVNESQVSGDGTVFAGDRVRTGTDGAAAISVSGQGSLLVEAQSTVSFPDQPQFLAELEQGKVSLRSLADTGGSRLRVGSFIVVPVPPAESLAEVERAPDGSATITCRVGSVGVIELDGPASLFMEAGQSAFISPDGKLQQQQAPTTPPQEAPPKKPPVKGGKGWIALVLAGAGGGGAAAALARRGKAGQPVSPSTP